MVLGLTRPQIMGYYRKFISILVIYIVKLNFHTFDIILVLRLNICPCIKLL